LFPSDFTLPELQKVYEQIEFNIVHIKAKEDEIENIAEEFVEVFDLSKPPLLRVKLIEIKEDRYVLLLDVHHIAIDGTSFGLLVKEVLEFTDLVLLDIKNYDPSVYKTLTGVSLSPTLKLLDYLRDKKVNTWIRYVLVPKLTDNLDSITLLAEHLKNYSNVLKIELLGFHKMGEFKWKELGIEYKLSDTKEPSRELLKEAKEIFERSGIVVSTNI
jgi:hypothetical protein